MSYFYTLHFYSLFSPFVWHNMQLIFLERIDNNNPSTTILLFLLSYAFCYYCTYPLPQNLSESFIHLSVQLNKIISEQECETSSAMLYFSTLPQVDHRSQLLTNISFNSFVSEDQWSHMASITYILQKTKHIHPYCPASTCPVMSEDFSNPCTSAVLASCTAQISTILPLIFQHWNKLQC